MRNSAANLEADIVLKQPNSRYCFLCGRENPIGLKVSFYEDDRRRVIARFTPREEHQGFPGVLHGGITTPCSTRPSGERWCATTSGR